MSLKSNWSGGTPLAWDGWRGMTPDGASHSPIEPVLPNRTRRPPSVRPSHEPRSPDEAIARARRALIDAIPKLELRDPMLPAALRFALDHGLDVQPSSLLSTWRSRMHASETLDGDLPWTLGFDAAPNSSAYDPADGVGALWRPRERDWLERDPTAYGRRLLAPIALAENVEFLASLGSAADGSIRRTSE